MSDKICPVCDGYGDVPTNTDRRIAKPCLCCASAEARAAERARESTKQDIRGFAIYLETTDTYGQTVRVKQSSAAFEEAVWIFCKDREAKESSPHFDCDGAKELIAALQQFVSDCDAKAMLVRIRETIARCETEKGATPQTWQLQLSHGTSQAVIDARLIKTKAYSVSGYPIETADLQGAAWAFVPKSEAKP